MSTATITPELRTLECAFGLTDYTKPVEAAKEYMRRSGEFYSHQRSKRFIVSVKRAWDEYLEELLDSELKSRFEDPTGYEAVRRVLAAQQAA